MSENFRNMGKPLFKGQKTHAITPEEWEILQKKIRVTGDLISLEQVMNALKTMADYPTGRQQIREIIASEQIFPVNCSKEADAKVEEYGVAGFNQRQVVTEAYTGIVQSVTGETFIHSKYIGNTKLFATILLHEMMHQRQSTNLPRSSIICDMETQALSAQLGAEIADERTECASYRQSYAQNMRKWRLIVDKKWPKPDWAPPFEPMEQGSMSDEEYARFVKAAQNDYIKQMAADETQAQFMADFTMSRSALNNGDFSMPVPSYEGIRTHLFYDSYGIRENLQTMILSDYVKEHLKSKYPALDIEKIDQHTRELNAEYFGLDKAVSLLTEKLQSTLTSQMSFKERVTSASKCIRELDCDKETKKILAEEMMEVFTQNREISDAKEISSILQRNLKTSYSHEDANREIDETGVDADVRRVLDETNSYLETVKYIANRSDIGPSAKLHQFAEVIRLHKEQYPEAEKSVLQERKEMLRIIRKETGLDGLPLIQNGLSLTETLRLSSESLIAQNDIEKEENMPLNKTQNSRMA